MAKKGLREKVVEATEKTADIIDRAVLWLDGLKKEAVKGDVEAVRRILVNHEINGDFAEVLVLVPAEAARLKEIIDGDSTVEGIVPLRNKLQAFHMTRPETVEAAEKLSEAVADCKKRLSQAELQREGARVAADELRGLESSFPEIVGKRRGKDIDHNAPLPTAICEALKKVGGDWRRGQSWRDAYRRPSAPQRRRRLVTAGGQEK